MPPDAPGLKIIHDWTRFWVPHTGTVDLSDVGFLRDPTETRLGLEPSSAHALPDLGNFRALALLGEPGIGKSTTLKAEADRIAAAGDPAVTSLYFDLRAFSSEGVLLQKVFGSAAWQRWKEGNGQLVLHLDSLDEALLRVETLGNLLAMELQEQPVDRLAIRIACRTAVWPSQTLGAALTQLWGAIATGVFELAPLRRRDVLAAAESYQIDGGKFIQDLIAASAVPFAIKPLTLNMLLGLYQRDGKLPASTTELYTKGCLKLCEEQNASRRETGRRGHLTLAQRLRVAERIAAATMLCNQYAVWTGPEAEGIPAELILVSALAGSQETGDFASFTISETDILEVLDTGLFNARGDNLMGWAHQSYAEFLGARYLLDKAVDPAVVLKILKHPDGGLVPQLSTVAAWAASLSPDIRSPLVTSEPLALLAADLSNWPAEELSALTAAWLEALAQRRLNDTIIGIALLYAKLKHPGIADILRPYLADKSIHAVARRAAVMIARACATTELQPELLAIAYDPLDDAGVRGRAVTALSTCGDATTPAQLLPLARSEVPPDPSLDIKGGALDQLWPNHLTGTELFAILEPPNEGVFGVYTRFLYDLPPTLKTADLIPGLAWATALIKRLTPYDHAFTLSRVADAILFRAWDVFEQPGLTQPFLDNVAARLFQHGNLCRGTDYDANKVFLADVADNTERRRMFLRALAATPVQQFDAYSYSRSGLLTRDDLVWLLSISPGGNQPDLNANPETLGYLIDTVFNWDSIEHGEAIYSAALRWPQLHQRYRLIFDGVLLDSPEVARHYELQSQLAELKEDKPPPLDPNPQARVIANLEKVEAGDLDAWWVCNIDLTLTPESSRPEWDLEFHINRMAGWETADAALRQRLIQAADRYLREAPCTADEWLGTRRYDRRDYAGWRSFLLLHEEAPALYAALPPAVWEKWAPAIVGVPKNVDTEHPKSEIEAYLDGYKKAPTAFVAAVRKIIALERQPPADAEPQPNPDLILLILREMPEAADLTALMDGIFGELQDPANTPAQFSALLEALLQHKYGPAQTFAEQCLTGPLAAPYQQIAAGKLMRHCAAATWPALAAYIAADDARARELFLEVAHHYHFDTPFYAGIPEAELGDLYILLERLFPRVEDPNHPAGRAHYVGPLDSIVRLRDTVPSTLVGMGTPESVAALRRSAAALPQLDWLPFDVARAEQVMRIRTWSPLALKELFSITDRGGTVLISSAEELCDLLVAALQNFEAFIAGQQTPVRSLWDRQANGTWRPVEENALSDVVKLYLERTLRDRGIIANREVEVSHAAGAAVGDRTDIRVDAVRRIPNSNTVDVLSAVIEVKGCWNKDLFSALTRQLYGNYMTRLEAPVGIYLVGWFDKDQWDPSDYRRDRTPNRQAADVLAQLSAEAAAIPKGFLIAPVLVRCQTP